MPAQPQVFSNAAKGGTQVGAPAGALTSAVAASAFAAGTWGLREMGNVEAANAGLPGSFFTWSAFERWQAPGFGAKIDLVLLSSGNWQATLFPGS